MTNILVIKIWTIYYSAKEVYKIHFEQLRLSLNQEFQQNVTTPIPCLMRIFFPRKPHVTNNWDY